MRAREAHVTRLAEIESRAQDRFGAAALRDLRAALALPLVPGLVTYPDGWRASLPTRTTLPHFPMVLHRGGFPDGS